ncbi:glycosyltransferase family 4 protein [Deinococcus sp.]|uniref:glycosyltransferase family 4 protein n=1 Tax=Deinococcus sp. TaxID=47478 RepID=UPI003C7BD168
MRILALNWRCFRHPQAGGGETNLFEQAERWAAQGHRVTVLCGDPGRQAAPEVNEQYRGVEVRRMGGRFGVYARVAAYLLRHGQDHDAVLDVSNGVPFFSPLFTASPSVLLVHHVHGAQWRSEFPAPVAVFGQFLEQRVVPALYRRRRVIAVSPTTEEGLLKLGYRAEQLQVIYNGVDLPASVPAQAPDAQRVLYLGRVKRYKRVDRLVRAVASLRASLPDIHLDIAGDGDARAEIEALVAELGMQRHVTVHGFVDDAQKAALLAGASVFATPSMHEGWGISVIEANAHGCPAVAYDVPGLRVAIRHQQTGLLAQDDDGFRDAIGTLLRDAPLRARYAAAAREWASRFDWDVSAASTLEVLDRARVAARGLSFSSEA